MDKSQVISLQTESMNMPTKTFLSIYSISCSKLMFEGHRNTCECHYSDSVCEVNDADCLQAQQAVSVHIPTKQNKHPQMQNGLVFNVLQLWAQVHGRRVCSRLLRLRQSKKGNLKLWQVYDSDTVFIWSCHSPRWENWWKHNNLTCSSCWQWLHNQISFVFKYCSKLRVLEVAFEQTMTIKKTRVCFWADYDNQENQRPCTKCTGHQVSITDFDNNDKQKIWITY